MEPMNPVPDKAVLDYPDHHQHVFGPPKDVMEEDCGYSASLMGTIVGGVFDGAPVIRTFFTPTPEELKALNDGGYIELYFMSSQMPPHNLLVWEK